MDLIYTQTKAGDYAMLDDTELFFIVASCKYTEKKEIKIYSHLNQPYFSFAKNDISNKGKIYKELEAIDSPKSALDFCRKYGTLVNKYSPIRNDMYFRTNFNIEACCKDYCRYIEFLTDKENTEKLPSDIATLNILETLHMDIDFMDYYHFMYYVQTLQLLSLFEEYNIRKTLSKRKMMYLSSLFYYYLRSVSAMLSREYICSIDGFKNFLNSFPFYRYVFATENPRLCTSNEIQQWENEFSEITEILYPTKPIDYTNLSTENALKLDRFVKYISENIINFHTKDIPLLALSSTGYTHSESTFQTLGDAIIFQKIFDSFLSQGQRACANEYCGYIFTPKRKNQIYCSEECAKKVATRNAMRRKRAKEKSQSQN